MKYIYSKLLILMILNLNVGYSQDTTIELEHKIARLIIEDLIMGDQAKEDLLLTQEQFGFLTQKISFKDSIIFKQSLKINNYEDIMGTRSQQLKLSKDLSTQLQLDLKKQKAKTKLFKLGGTTVLIGALLFAAL